MFAPETLKKIGKLAAEIDVQAAALAAVAEVESAGVTSWLVHGKSLPPIRFEGHYFYRLTKGTKREAAVRAGLAAAVSGVVKNPKSYQARYELLERAMKIDEVAALMSTSWGLGQVMGAHAVKLGYPDVQHMVARAKESVDGQVEIMGKYIQKFGLVDELQTKGWQSFADQYNGPASRKNNYSTKIAAAYKVFTKVYADPNFGASGVEAPVALYTDQQKSLEWLGYFHGTVDGTNSAAFRDGLRAFQRAHGLIPDGKWGPLSDAELDKAVAEKQASQGDTAAKTGSAVGTGAATIEIVNAAVGQIKPVADLIGSNTLHYVVVALVVVAAIIGIYCIYKKRKAGV